MSIPFPEKHNHSPPAAASSAYRPDIPREAMRVAAFIVRRMALDMREIEQEWGYVEPWHLHERGWTPHQVTAYGQMAAEKIALHDHIDKVIADGGAISGRIAASRVAFTSAERTLAAFSLIGALALIGAGALEIARPGTLPAFNAAAARTAPQTVSFPVCRPEGA